MNSPNALHVTVFAYPPAKPQKVITDLDSLILRLCDEYAIPAPIRTLDGSRDNRSLFALLTRCIDSCLESLGALDIRWLWALKTYAALPNDDTLLFLQGSGLIDSWESLVPFFAEVTKTRSESGADNSSWFIALEGVRLRPNGGPWGACYDSYPFAVAVEVKGYRESIFHEFLHIFGVSEGYNEKTKDTLSGCKNCWMQYNATRGSGLCATHLGELKASLSKVSTQQ